MTKPQGQIQIGAFRFDAGAGVLLGFDGREIPLRPQTGRVLSLLADAAGELVTKDRLMSLVWADTHVTDDSLVQCISEIRKALGPEAGQLLKTVPKQGYRLELSPEGPPPAAPRRGALLAVLGLVLLVGLVLVAWMAFRPQDSRDPRSIAVLPLADLSEGEGYRYFSSGLTEDLVVSLSKLPDLQVAARTAAAAAREATEDPQEIATALGVEYLVDGSIRRRGDALRLTAVLVDGKTGRSLWAESYDGSLVEVFDFQDAVLADLARVLAVRLSPAERARLDVRGTVNARAYDQYLLGRVLQNVLTPGANSDAETAFRAAIALDPDYAAAHSYLSLVLSNSAEYGWADRRDLAIEEALHHGDRAVALDPGLAFARFTRGRLKSRRFVGDLEGAEADLKAAMELDPGYDDARAFLANVLVMGGRADEAKDLIDDVLARNPASPYWYYVPLGLSHYYKGDFGAAEVVLRRVLDGNPNSPHGMRTLIATYGQMGRLEDAEWLAFEYEALGHEASVSAILFRASIKDEGYRAALAEGLRKAGLPE